MEEIVLHHLLFARSLEDDFLGGRADFLQDVGAVDGDPVFLAVVGERLRVPTQARGTRECACRSGHNTTTRLANEDGQYGMRTALTF